MEAAKNDPSIEGLSGRLWPIHLKPLDDELLSSWLVRLARAHGVKLHTFCDLAWPGKAMWNRDIDKSADEEVLRVLSERTATPLERVRATTLGAYAGWLYETHNPHGNTKWILPVGVYHRTRRRPGLQFCPRCLAEDAEPYFRRRWRLAFVTVCETHGILLHDCCPRCGAPVNFHRNSVDADPVTSCARCGLDLGTTPCRRRPRDVESARRQQALLAILDAGWTRLADATLTYSVPYFDVLHQLMKLLAHGRGAARMRRATQAAVGTSDAPPCFRRRDHDIEALRVADRRALAARACWLLDKWPSRFVDAGRQQGVLSSVLLRDMGKVPFWFWTVVRRELYAATYSPTGAEIASATSVLSKPGVAPALRAVSRLLGVRQVGRKRGIRHRQPMDTGGIPVATGHSKTARSNSCLR